MTDQTELSTSTLCDSLVLILDCQTTGMRPPAGALLEIAWAWVRASDEGEPIVHSFLCALPEGASIPARVSEITGISDADLVGALAAEELKNQLLFSLEQTSSPRATAIIHYAQFEKPFLHDLFSEEPPFEIVCSYHLSKRLFPHLPSSNIRGVSGFFGGRLGEIKRAASHVKATITIWQGLAKELEARGVRSLTELPEWLKGAPKIKSARYEYRIEKEKRLALPDRPGIYRMISKTGEILYVGKATSLKDRVNSYFRGKRGRDKRKLELMAQVWDLETTETRTAVEAAILESDEIKKYDPPYNVSLKTGKRRLVYYSRDFLQVGDHQDEAYPLGPFRRFNNIERLHLLAASLQTGTWAQVFYEPYLEADLEKGFECFCARHCPKLAGAREPLKSVRSLLALGTKMLRRLKDASAIAPDETVEEVADQAAAVGAEFAGQTLLELTPDEMADKFERLLMRAASELNRSKLMTRLLNARVRWESPEGWVALEVHRGRLGAAVLGANGDFPWNGLDIADYDRMSILVSEIAKYPHAIEGLPQLTNVGTD